MLLPQPVSGDRQGRTSYSDLLALGDERIMQELQTGNTDAFAVIFKRYHRLVHVTALHILRDAARPRISRSQFFWRFIVRRDNLTCAEELLKCGSFSTPIAGASTGGITYQCGALTMERK